ncbi:monofunctional biosynthetic peptidoglycan transglycosylase [Gelidibacter algens]|jgi:monofunctional biosynthetic peptidoglycan transglycosylase|uniref:Biosynthetic peptidoglycan transglycosylase n=1 Tax=Gelidibacter algens TaxID=49280 RepID=A0A1A7R335_9FLAO|nr:monofunctional biosynthetic peptidoglycan transglycosylase [Gelidibacter algens]OBX26675.1 monofunctional biosynthetic peptidoglycan transglycosylase [Gelidibacter algens]RAJ25736.1 monofunctional biosynthetic peptidoglycan transglycosylase [Gelidibacter algens]
MIKKILKFFFKVLLWFLAIPLIGVIVFKWVPVPATPLMVIRYFEQKEAEKETVWKHDWVPLEEISKNLQLAVICSEDQNFLKHNGFDMEAIEKAFDNNQKGKKVRGASTISQQTAKNVFLWPQRSWLRKGMETYVTFLIELIWTKERIMEVYLNSIEMGNGVYGAEAASQRWFKKSASKLSKSEAAAIAAILPKPLNYRANPPTNYIAKRKLWIVRQMGYHGALNYDSKDEK